jgi:hypothetical protein
LYSGLRGLQKRATTSLDPYDFAFKIHKRFIKNLAILRY